jgi:serine/threonine protein kinase
MDTIHNDGKITYYDDTYVKEQKCDDAKLIEKLRNQKRLAPNIDYKINCDTVNQYSVGRHLGEGLFNNVYELIDNNDKVIRITKDSLTQCELDDEINGLFLQHYIYKQCREYICAVYEFGYMYNENAMYKPPRVYAILEKLSVQDLRKIEEKDKKNYNFRKLIKDSVKGLKCINSNGFIHNDINDTNIGIGNDGNAKIIDFGVCEYIDFPENRNTGEYYKDIFNLGNNVIMEIYFKPFINNQLNRSYFDNYLVGKNDEIVKNDTDNLIDLTEAILINRTIEDAKTALEFNWFKDELEGGSKYKKSRTIKSKKKKGNKKKTKKTSVSFTRTIYRINKKKYKNIQKRTK